MLCRWEYSRTTISRSSQWMSGMTRSFYQEKEFPAGFMAMSILNIPEEDLPELIQAGGAPTFLFPVVVQGSDEEAAAVFPAAGTDIVPDRASLEVSALLL